MSRFPTILLTALATAMAGCAPPPRGTAALPKGRHASSRVAHGKPDAPVLIGMKNGRYKVAQPWTVDLNGRRWQVQKGYRCNGISAPSKIRNSLGNGVNEPETWAAVFHDWLYTQPGMTRDRADRLFYELLLAYGVPSVKARLMYTSVSAYSASKKLR